MLQLSSESGTTWGPLRVTLMSPVALDERDDLAWAECEPPLRLGGETFHLVLLQPRYRYLSLWEVGADAVPVYVCVTSGPDESAERLTRKQVRVVTWALVTEDRRPSLDR